VPADPTDADRERAADLFADIGNLPATRSPGVLAERIAQALADERERAVAPFLALADQWTAGAAADERAGLCVLIHRGTAAWHIRAAAQEDPK
jgi:hypothetical protein